MHLGGFEVENLPQVQAPLHVATLGIVIPRTDGHGYLVGIALAVGSAEAIGIEQLAETDEGIFMVAGLVALPIALLALWLFHRLASPFEPVERQSLIKNEGMAVLVTTLLMLGMFTVMIGLELLIRLYPDLGGV